MAHATMMIIIILVLAVVVCSFVLFTRFEKRRAEEAERAQWREEITKLFGPTIARKIFGHKIWTGMTAEQLHLSWGSPEDRDRTVTKRTTKETWKYNQYGVNRYQDRIFLEDDKVVGWKGQSVADAEQDGEVETETDDIDEPQRGGSSTRHQENAYADSNHGNADQTDDAGRKVKRPWFEVLNVILMPILKTPKPQ